MNCPPKCLLLHPTLPKRTNRCSTWLSRSLCYRKTICRHSMECKVLHKYSWNKANIKITTWPAIFNLLMSIRTTLLMEVRPNKLLYQFFMHRQSQCRNVASNQISTQSNTKSTKILSKMSSKFLLPKIMCLEITRNKAIILSHQQHTITTT